MFKRPKYTSYNTLSNRINNYLLDKGEGIENIYHTKEYLVPFFFNIFTIYVILEQKDEYKWKVFINIYLFGLYNFNVFSLDTTIEHKDKDEDIYLGFVNSKEAESPLVQLTKHI